MLINTDKQITDKNYITTESNKNKICLYSSNLPGLSNYDYQLFKNNGYSKEFPHFTITEDGTIYQHFDIKYQSQIFEDGYLDVQTIFICLSNLGWLKYDSTKEIFSNWCNFEVKMDNVLDKPFRDIRYWDKYTEEQLKSSSYLCKKLCEDLSLKKEMVGHIFIHEPNVPLETIYTMSNIDTNSLNLNPSFDFKMFFKKINAKR